MADGAFPREAKAFAGKGILDPHEVPSSLANHGVENMRRVFFNPRPAAARISTQRVEPAGKRTSVAQKNRVKLQTRALLDAICSRAGAAIGGTSRTLTLRSEFSVASVASERADESPEKPVVSDQGNRLLARMNLPRSLFPWSETTAGTDSFHCDHAGKDEPLHRSSLKNSSQLLQNGLRT